MGLAIRRSVFKGLILLGAWLLLGPGQPGVAAEAPELDELKQELHRIQDRLETVEQENQTLKKKIDRLEHQEKAAPVRPRLPEKAPSSWKIPGKQAPRNHLRLNFTRAFKDVEDARVA